MTKNFNGRLQLYQIRPDFTTKNIYRYTKLEIYLLSKKQIILEIIFEKELLMTEFSFVICIDRTGVEQ